MTYSGFAHFDSDELCGWTGELGRPRDPDQYGCARARLMEIQGPEEEAALKNTRTYGAGLSLTNSQPQDTAHNHFGFVLVSCDGADLRPVPHGVQVYAHTRRFLEPLPRPEIPRREVLDELIGAIRHDRRPIHTGEWGMATMEVCLAILESAQNKHEVMLSHQTSVPDPVCYDKTSD